MRGEAPGTPGSVTRRQFIQRLGATALGAGAAGCTPKEAPPLGRQEEMFVGEAFPFAEPAEVDVDAGRVRKAVRFIDRKLEQGTFPGAALVATRHGRTFLERYWGTYCSPERRENPYGGRVVNMLYSFSKALSATVVVMAHQDGLVDYGEPVSTYIPEFTGGGKDAITIRHLLTHSAGIPVAPFACVTGEDRWNAFLEDLCVAEVAWRPGSKTSYHAVTGMFIAAEAVRRVSGMKSWQAICRERLFRPLGADSFTFDVPPTSTRVALTPQPDELPCPLDVDHWPFLGHPAGGCFGKVTDIMKLLHLHLAQGAWQGRQLIAEDAWREMHRLQYQEQIDAARRNGYRPVHEYWALGWLLRGATAEHFFGFGDCMSERAFGHAGIDTVMTVADPATGLAVAFLTTDSPKPEKDTTRLRCTAANLIAKALR